jgi:rhamnogalacturonan endolyase
MTRLLPLAAAAFLVLASRPTANDQVEIFRDDFSRFLPGVLSAPLGLLNGAIQEYHYIEHRGVATWPWRNPVVHLDSWAAGDEDGRPYLEQHLVNEIPQRVNPLFVTGDPDWRDYTVEAGVRPLTTEKDAGIVFRYHTSRHYYLFTLEAGTRVRLAMRQPMDESFRVSVWRELGAKPFTYDVRREYRMRVAAEGRKLRAFIDGQLVLSVEDAELSHGQAGVTANMPARFRDFRVTMTPAAASAFKAHEQARQTELNRLRSANPAPVVWKKFETPGFGAGRNVRFGDLDGDGHLDMLIAQNVPKVRGDAFDHISCLTAVTLEGRVLWQQGRPNPKNGLLTNDNPFQIHDLDGDGKAEVVLARDFRLQVLDGATGAVKKAVWLPAVPADTQPRPYDVNIGDSILFLDLSGKGRPQQILLKDRYRRFWIFDANLELRWQGEGQTGHYPFPLDVDGAGGQEFLIGYSLWGADGKPRWSHDQAFKDHADAISMGNFSGKPDGPVRAYINGSDEGFIMIDVREGRVLKQHRLGHAQTQSVGKYRPDLPGLQIMIANFWQSPGIVTLLDANAMILAQEELTPGSTHLAPVNWRGDGVEFALLSSNLRDGGMLDGNLRRVVMFPDDGHPDLAYHVANVTGDARDEVVVWDQNRVWIYTQDRPASGGRVYSPVRNPDYNDSNYRATVSLPGR